MGVWQGLSNVFYLIGHFWCWCKTYCSSLIATKGFGKAVSPIFFPAFAVRFSHFNCKEVADLQKINLLNLFYSIFSQKIPSCIAVLFLTPLKSIVEQGWHFCKTNIPRGCSMSSHTDTLKSFNQILLQTLAKYNSFNL